MVDEREKRIKLIEQRLRRFSSPRLHVSLILSLTALAGFLASFFLLKIGLIWMAIRYPFAILIAYGIFLLLLRIWLWFHGRTTGNPDIDIALDFGGIGLPGGSGSSAEGFKFGGGGDFAGAGADGDWGSPVALSSAGSSGGGGSSSGGLGFDLDLDEGWYLVLAVIALIGGLIATLWIVYIAPGLLAEILLDGVLAAGFYKRVKNIERHYWLTSALRQTALPALIVAVFFGIAGFALNTAAPGAHSVGDVVRLVLKDKSGK